MDFVRLTTKQFRKDVQRLQKSGYALSKLGEAIDLLAHGAKLPEKYRDHELKGDFQGIRECHIAPDWLLMYKKNKEELILLLLRTGTHRDVLGME